MTVEYSIPTAKSEPVEIVTGADGNLWFTENAGNKIGQLSSGVQLSPALVNLVTAPGSSPSAQTLTLSNTSPSVLSWSVGMLPSWLSVSPSTGMLAAGTTQPLTLTFSTSNPTPQTYTTMLQLTTTTGSTPLLAPITVVAAAASKTWYFAEGYTGSGFTEFLTLANPGTVSVTVQVQYLLGSGGPIIKAYAVAPTSRFTLNVGSEIASSTDKNVSLVVTSDQPIVAERPIYFTYTGMVPPKRGG